MKTRKQLHPIAQHLADHLRSRGWTVYRLETESDVSRQSLGRILSGESHPHKVPLGTWIRIAETFGVTLTDLIEV